MPMSERFKGWLIVAIAYVFALSAAIFVTEQLDTHPLVEVGAAQFSATIIFFIFSFLCNNSSINDTYWSSAPIAFVIYYLSLSGFEENVLRKVLLLCFVSFWGLRLTAYVLYYWKGLNHEDWRFVDLRHKTGKGYWVVSLFGLHLLPALLIYMASLSFYPIVLSEKSFGVADMFSTLIVLVALAVGAISDEQLRRFRTNPDKSTLVLSTGLWRLTRHPNYVGETLFWWGIWLMGLTSGSSMWWFVIGPVGIICLFQFVSIDLMEERLMKKDGYAIYRDKVARYFPFPGK